MKALFVIAEKFRDEELFHTKEELEKEGVKTVIASKKTGSVNGMMGGVAQAEKVLSDVSVDDFDVVVFVGGSGSQVFYDDPVALDLAREAFEANKVIAAICIAPGILANAGVLEGRKATIWNGDGSYSRVLQEKGAVFTDEDVTVDGRIVTANGPSSARKFGRKIIGLL